MVVITKVAVLLSLAFSSVQAHPWHKSDLQSPDPAHLFKRALPQFQNFEPNDPKVEQLTKAFKDMKTLVQAVVDAADTEQYSTIFKNYFQPRHRAAVKQVFTNMITPAENDPDTGADVLSTIVVDGRDYYSASGIQVAYTSNEPTKMHFSKSDKFDAYKYPDLSQITCETIGTVLSDKMLSLGGYALVHELTHAAPVFSSEETRKVTDYQNTNDLTYGPQHVRQFAAGQGRNAQGQPIPARWAIENADSYAWLANEVYWTIKCKRDFDEPTDNSYAPAGVCLPAATGPNCAM